MSVVVHPEFGATARESRSNLMRWMALGLAALLLLGAFVAKSWWAERSADPLAGTTAVTAEGFAAEYGINIALIGTTAAGGLIDFRYQVVDPVKADPLIHELELVPKLIVEETGAVVAMQSLPHDHSRSDLELGGTYFFLMANTGNAIKAGSLITVVVGEHRLEHIVAQG